MGKKSEEETAGAKRVIEELRPHFIFNVLNQMRFWIKEEPDVANGMVYDLANYLRLTIAIATGEEEGTLREEVKKLRSYLNLEAALQPRLHILFEAAGAEEAWTLQVEPGTLYHMAESLIKGSVRNTREERTLRISEERQGHLYRLCLTIEETGESREWQVDLEPVR